MEKINRVAAGAEEGSDVVGEPERTKDVGRVLGALPGNVRFADDQRNVRRHAIGLPRFHNVIDVFGLVVEAVPLNLAGLKRIVLE